MNNRSLAYTLAPALSLAFAAILFINLSFSLPPGEPTAPPDLAITKSASPTPVLLGNRLTYSILIQNLSNQKASSVIMTDTLPANVIVASISSTKGVCSRTSNIVRCVIGNVNKNTKVTVTVVVTPTQSGIMTNTAMVTTSSNDTNPANNISAITTSVRPKADLVISKTGLPEPVLSGNRLTYTLVITNAGPSNATNVMVTDTLPLNLSYGSSSPGCHVLTNVVTCGTGMLASGGTRTFTITATPGALAEGTILNQAIVNSDEIDPDTTNNTAYAINTVNPAADIAVHKTSAPTPALLGHLLTYTITATNNGPSSAANIVITDTLPTGVTFHSASSSCLPSGATVVCGIDAIPGGGAAAVTIGVIPNTTGHITNTVSAAGAQFDPNRSNNTASASTTVVPAADLAIAKTAAANLVLPGQALTYTIAITNNGPSNATGVVMTDSLPASVIFRSASPSRGSCSGGSRVTCPIGSLNSGASASITIIVTPTVVEAIVNTATVASSLADPDLANNTSVLRNAVNPVDLSVSKIASSYLLDSGRPVTYTIVVTNNGPLPGSGVKLTDTLPANAVLGPVVSSQGVCSGTGVVGCDLGDLNVGAHATVTLVVTPTSTGTVVNTVVVSANEPDPNLADNTALATSLINPINLSIKKTATPNPAYVGGHLTYTLVVTNNGPFPATGVNVTDTLPIGVSFASASSGCTPSGNRVVCSASALAIGANRTFTIAVTPGAAAVGTITNTVVASSDQPESAPADNTAVAITNVQESADLKISKAGTPNPLYAGNSLFYILTVVNSGPSTARNVIVTDTLPAAVTFSAASSVCSPASGIVTCTIGTLPAGSIASLLISVKPTASASGLITNTATVAGSTHDPGLTNNSASAGTTVIAVADLVVTKRAAPQPAQSGRPLIYTVVVTNAGPSNAGGVIITDTLPVSVTFNSASAGCIQTSGTVTCSIPAIAAGSSRTVSITVTPQAATTGTYIENTVAVASNTLDPDQSDNSFVLDIPVDPVDLGVIKTGAPNPVYVAKPLTYTIVVTNYGPSGATGVVLLDSLPPSVVYKAASAVCLNSGGLVTCNLPDLAVRASTTVTIAVVPTVAGLITNTASVDANEVDGNLANNTAAAYTKVRLYQVFVPIVLRNP